ncbi:MAG TPA: hypothetical protein V6D17_17250 [Candidatus Obscuribacterales bacterium]
MQELNLSTAPPGDELGLEQALTEALTNFWCNPFALAQLNARLACDYWLMSWKTSLSFMGLTVSPHAVPDEDDRRFQDKQWDRIPFFSFLKQAYLINARNLLTAIKNAAAPMSKSDRLKAELAARALINDCSPSRFASMSPEGWSEIARTFGFNLALRWQRLLLDRSQRTALFRIRLADTSTCLPGGNNTYLCISPGETRSAYGDLDELIRALHPDLEQGGFLERSSAPAVVRLQMAGGEFCGNAARCAAAWVSNQYFGKRLHDGLVAYNRIREHDDGISFFIDMSGASRPLAASCKRRENEFWVEVEMPIWKRFNRAQETIAVANRLLEVTKVELEGIVHILIDRHMLPFTRSPEEQRKLLQDIERQLSLQEEPAIGLIWHDDDRKPAIDPVVYVRKTGSFVYESACGSGSLALAAVRATGNDADEVAIVQPSGSTIACRIAKKADGTLKRAFISGPVEIKDDFRVPSP